MIWNALCRDCATRASACAKSCFTIWRDIPSADNGFAHIMMQAIATTTAREGCSPNLRLTVEERVAKLLDDCLPRLHHISSRKLANILLMAFDGYTLNFSGSRR